MSLVLLAVICLMGACRRDPLISSLHRSEIIRINLADCADRQFPIGEQKLIDQFWRAVSGSQEIEWKDLKLNTGYGRAWIYTKGREEPVYFEIVASLVHGPVIVYGSRRMLCNQCEEFFAELKKTYPDFNWCQQPL